MICPWCRGYGLGFGFQSQNSTRGHYILIMRLLLFILLTTSLFGQRISNERAKNLAKRIKGKEYNIENIYERASDKIYIKKFSDEVVNGNVYQMFGDQKVVLGKMVKGKKEGKFTYWFSNGSKSEEVFLSNGKVNGKFVKYYEDGTLQLQGNAKDGNIYYKKRWNEKGELVSEKNLNKLTLSGVNKIYKKGRLNELNYYKNNLRHGTDTTFDNSGNIYATVEWVKGKKEGYSKSYSNGQVIRTTGYENGEVVFFKTTRDSLNFIEDSLLVYKILEIDIKDIKGYDGYIDADSKIYKWAYKDELLYTTSKNVNDLKIFPLKRGSKSEFVLITNINNEAVGYVSIWDWKFNNTNDEVSFNKDLKFTSRKYERDRLNWEPVFRPKIKE